MDCQKVYIGQTGRSLKIRYKEHIRSIRYNREDSGYATHILNNIHCYGKIKDIMEKIDQAKKGRIMRIKENLHIYTHKKQNQLIEEQRENIVDYTNIRFDIGIMYMTPMQPTTYTYWIRAHTD
jgi:hypothetical protein